jgi:hypothetical protein
MDALANTVAYAGVLWALLGIVAAYLNSRCCHRYPQEPDMTVLLQKLEEDYDARHGVKLRSAFD